MRVTHISIVHKPLDSRIFEKECRDLAAAGYDVHLLVGGPPADLVDGVRLHSLADDADRPSVRRQVGRFWRALRRAYRLRPSVYHLHDPHLIPLGLLMKLTGARVVYDVHEDYPGYARSKASHPLAGRLKARLWLVLEWLARRWFDGFVCTSPALARRFPSATTVVVHNFPRHLDFAAAAASPMARPYRERRNRVIATGYMREMRCFWEIVRALELLPEDLDCRLRVIGTFRPPELVARARALGAWSRMDAIPWQRHEVVVRELFGAKIGVVLLHPLPNHDDPVRSNKLFEFMAAGIPVIASDLPPWREIVGGIGCGVVVDPLDPAAIAAAIEHLLQHPAEAEAMGKRGREAVWAGLNWDREMPKLLSMYRALDGEPPRFEPAAEPEPQAQILSSEPETAVPVGEQRAVSP